MPSGQTHDTRDKEAAANLRRIKVAELLLQGYSYRAMAEMLGVSRSTINNDVHKIFDNWAEEMRPEERHEWILRENAKLDTRERRMNEVLQKLSDEDGQISEDDIPLALKTEDRIDRIQQRRAKMLGLDAPTRIDISSADIDAEIERALEELLTRRQTEAPE